MNLRFSPAAAQALREAIAQADHTEVFAIGEVRDRQVVDVVIAARGTVDRVLAVFGRPRPGQVVVHNHPSGDLTPSDPDLAVAAQFSEDGVGFVIVDGDVRRDRWVVEPWTRSKVPIDPQVVAATFTRALADAMPGWEARPAQLQMAERVRASLDEGQPLLVEAGTGTGKSLAYLVPAAHWALANEGRVVVSTRTRALQAQLLSEDVPMLAQAGLDVRVEVLEGRSNYVCRRRLELAQREAKALSGDDDERTARIEAIAAWTEGPVSGSRRDLRTAVDGEVWEAVRSDTDLTLATRCPHHERCFFYGARRKAADAHLVIVNHKLLLADLRLRRETGRGVLPAYDRVVLDEAHHLADEATGAAETRVTAFAVRRAIAPLLDRKRRRGALSRLVSAMEGSAIPENVARRAADKATAAEPVARRAAAGCDAAFAALLDVVDGDQPTRRLRPEDAEHPDWNDRIRPAVLSARHALTEALAALSAIDEALEGHRPPDDKAQPRLDLRRAIRRLAGHVEGLDRFAHLDDDERCRWVEATRGRSGPESAVCTAPIDVAKWLEETVWRQVRGAVATSATLSVGGRFSFFRARHGLRGGAEAVLPSPFDHARQAILAMPTDVPEPDHPDRIRVTARILADALTDSRGGAFVLCTSYRDVNAYTAALRAALPPTIPVLSQATLDRAALVRRFHESPDAVLVGTDTLWEGVSIAGEALRVVAIPRLPFRVPTDPIEQARHELLQSHGQDPFHTAMLPAAILKLRQGYGRLIRTRRDRGVVLLLDPRVHTRRYGRVLLASLPPARRVRGPWHEIRGRIASMLAPPGATTGYPPGPQPPR